MELGSMINITRHIKILNKQACKPISMGAADLPLFNLNTQLTSKLASNNNEWRVAV
jgi:hypothetical protein